jgi:hypothetical protein
VKQSHSILSLNNLVRKFNIILILIFVISGTRISFSQSKPFEISLSTSKTEYFEGEKVYVIVKYKNTGSNTDSIADETLYHTPDKLKLIATGGETAEQFSPIRSQVENTYWVLKPGKSTTLKYYIGDFFYYPNDPLYHMGDEYFLRIGNYKIYFGNLSTEFSISHPSGKEEAAYEKMSEARNILTVDINNKGYDTTAVLQKSDVFNYVYTKYPESVYAEDAFMSHFNYYILVQEMDSLTFATANGFIERFPNNEKLDYVLLKMSKYLYSGLGQDAATKFLLRIAKRYQGINAGIYANTLIISEKYKK